jgi:hypothetical protein
MGFTASSIFHIKFFPWIFLLLICSIIELLFCNWNIIKCHGYFSIQLWLCLSWTTDTSR